MVLTSKDVLFQLHYYVEYTLKTLYFNYSFRQNILWSIKHISRNKFLSEHKHVYIKIVREIFVQFIPYNLLEKVSILKI